MRRSLADHRIRRRKITTMSTELPDESSLR